MPRWSNASGLLGPISGKGRIRFNVATGGTVTDVSNYNGTGGIWRAHTFTANGSFTVVESNQVFRTAVIGGGGGVGSHINFGGNPGAGGGGGGSAGGFGGDVCNGSSGRSGVVIVAYRIG